MANNWYVINFSAGLPNATKVDVRRAAEALVGGELVILSDVASIRGDLDRIARRQQDPRQTSVPQRQVRKPRPLVAQGILAATAVG